MLQILNCTVQCNCTHQFIIVYTLGQKDKATREDQQQMKAVVMQMLSVTTQRKAALVSQTNNYHNNNLSSEVIYIGVGCSAIQIISTKNALFSQYSNLSNRRSL